MCNLPYRTVEHEDLEEPTCQCGCGQRLVGATYKYNDKANGIVKGQPKRFIHGHNARRSPHDYVIDEATGCWIWQRSKDHRGYGHLRDSGRIRSAHVVYFERQRGSVPPGLDLHHTCHNRACVNPDHLEALSHAAHSRNHGKKITFQIAEAMRSEYATGNSSQRQIADKYGVDKSMVQHVVRNMSWTE